MPKSIEDIARNGMREFLPDALRSAFASYKKFNRKQSGLLPDKDFALHHNACKAATGHIAALIKFAAWADVNITQYEDDIASIPEPSEELKRYHAQLAEEDRL